MEPIIEVRNISKRYNLGSIGAKTLRDELEVMWGRLRGAAPTCRNPRNAKEFWALDDVSFTVQRGETVGLIGRNGAGKSTLLKVLSRITEPTSGEAELRGRVSSLLEVGSGFHPELSGRENIFLNGAILGMRRTEIQRKFDEIVAFSEVGKFIDTPVKRYSSGMYVRLAFAVAAHLEPEILIVDEVLAVGDASFQQKCVNKMSEVAGEGRTVIFVSHRTASVQSLCSRAVWIDGGKVRMNGECEPVLDAYLRALQSAESNNALLHSVTGDITVDRITLRGADGESVVAISPGDSLTVEVAYTAHRPVREPYLAVYVGSQHGTVFMAHMALDNIRPKTLEGKGIVRCAFPDLPLMPKQSYIVSFSGFERDGRTTLFKKSEVARFYVNGTAEALGFEAEPAERLSSHCPPMLVPYIWTLPDGAEHAVLPRLKSTKVVGG